MTPGTRIGAYEIVTAIGSGGMGEVYRARDTRLEREVALKILPDTFASDADRLLRFEREAKTLAALNHPHIAQIYGLEESVGGRDLSPAGAAGNRDASAPFAALVMELVDGEDLAQRIAAGRFHSTTHCQWHGRSPKRSRRRMMPASSTAISSRPTSRCGPTGQ